jgi:hypothetical protein
VTNVVEWIIDLSNWVSWGKTSPFKLSYGALEITDEAGAVVWKGRPDGLIVKSVVGLRDHTAAIVLLDADDLDERRRNLVLVDVTGRTAWRAELPSEEEGDRYVGVSVKRSAVVARSRSGYQVQLDPRSGRILKRTRDSA